MRGIESRALVCKLRHPDGRRMFICTTTELHPHERFAFIMGGSDFPVKVTTHPDFEECDHHYALRIKRHVQNGFELVWQTEAPIELIKAVGLNAYAGDWADNILRRASMAMEPGLAWN